MNEMNIKNIVIFISFVLFLFLGLNVLIPSYSSVEKITQEKVQLYEPKLKIKSIEENLDFPTHISFLDSDDILVYEKSGLIKRVTDGKTMKDPLFNFKTITNEPIIMKGIIAKEKMNQKDKISHDVFFNYVQCHKSNECTYEIISLELDDKNKELINLAHLVSLPLSSDFEQNQGIFRVGIDNNIYLKLAELEAKSKNKHDLEGKNNWLECIIKSGQNTNYDQNSYGASKLIQQDNGHGLRYAFGTDYDPYSGQLWYLDNDKIKGDKISILKRSLKNNFKDIDRYEVTNGNNYFCIEKIYKQNAELRANDATSYKSLVFLDSKALGNKYMNNLFVIANATKILEFDLPKNRNGLSLASTGDNADINLNHKESIFADGFSKLNDLQVNPYDGTLYAIDSGTIGFNGYIYKIDRSVDSDSWFMP